MSAHERVYDNEKSEKTKLTVAYSGTPIIEQARKLGTPRLERFWGRDTGLELIPIPQTLDNRLMHLRTVLRLMPDLKPEHIEWLQNKRTVTEASTRPLLQREIKYLKDPIGLHASRPLTVSEAYAKPSILEIVNDSLLEQGDPVIAVYEVFAADAERNYVPERARKLGENALEIFVFAAGGRPFTNVVNTTTINFYKK